MEKQDERIDYRVLYHALFADVSALTEQLAGALADAEERFLDMGEGADHA